MAPKHSEKSSEQRLEEKLDALLRLTQDLFIVQALKAGMTNSGIRRVLGVQNTRVSNIAKHIE